MRSVGSRLAGEYPRAGSAWGLELEMVEGLVGGGGLAGGWILESGEEAGLSARKGWLIGGRSKLVVGRRDKISVITGVWGDGDWWLEEDAKGVVKRHGGIAGRLGLEGGNGRGALGVLS